MESGNQTLSCKTCGRQYETGKFCPECGQELVGHAVAPHAESTLNNPPHRDISNDRKPRRVKLLIVIALAVMVLAVIALAGASSPEYDLSAAQQDIIDAFGYPAQFTLSFLPQGEGEQMTFARTETWYYPDHEKKILFVSGAIVSVEPHTPGAGATSYPNIRPDEFSVSMKQDDVTRKVGGDVQPVDFLPGLPADGAVRAYLSENAVFAVENGHLMYLQTVGLGVEE